MDLIFARTYGDVCGRVGTWTVLSGERYRLNESLPTRQVIINSSSKTNFLGSFLLIVRVREDVGARLRLDAGWAMDLPGRETVEDG